MAITSVFLIFTRRLILLGFFSHFIYYSETQFISEDELEVCYNTMLGLMSNDTCRYIFYASLSTYCIIMWIDGSYNYTIMLIMYIRIW